MFTDEHPKPPPPLQGLLKEIFTDTFEALVKDLEAVTDAVGGTVSAERAKIKLEFQNNVHRIYHNNYCNKLLFTERWHYVDLEITLIIEKKINTQKG